MIESDYVTHFSNKHFAPMALKAHQKALERQIEWEVHDDNRREAFFNRVGHPYQYGRDRAFRPQYPQMEPLELDLFWDYVELVTGVEYGYCFINDYRNGAGNIGWHTDASPSIDKKKPIAVLSIGAVRSTSFRPIGKYAAEHFETESGDILMMNIGTNQKYEHAVLSDTSVKLPRMSLVFRGAAPWGKTLRRDFAHFGVQNEAKTYEK